MTEQELKELQDKFNVYVTDFFAANRPITIEEIEKCLAYTTSGFLTFKALLKYKGPELF